MRIYLLTARPGIIKREVEINLAGERNYKIKRGSKFQRDQNEITDCLRNESAFCYFEIELKLMVLFLG